MRFTPFSLTVSVIPFIILLFISCNSSKEVATIESTNSKPEVVVETTAAIVGGLEALQRKLKYPPKAKKEGVETTIKAKVLVNKNGKVEDVSFEEETDYGFEEAATEALHAVKFKAGERNGEPVNMYVTIPVQFKQ